MRSVKDFTLKERLNPDIMNEIQRTKEEEKKANRSKMVYKGYNTTMNKTILQSILNNLKVRLDHKILT